MSNYSTVGESGRVDDVRPAGERGLSGILFGTRPEIAPLIARLTIGAVMFPHGTQKLFGWFSGYGFNATLNAFTQSMHIPKPLAALAILTEGIAPILLILGLLSRVAALGIIGIMLGAIMIVHAPNGFFMNWFGNQKGEGYEYHLLVIGLCLIVVLRGGGLFSADRAIIRR